MNRPILLTKEFFPAPGDNFMRNVGDTKNARETFLRDKPSNLHFLLKKRYSWMNNYIDSNEFGIEVGCGSGLSKLFIDSDKFLLTDYSNTDVQPWVQKNVDALNMPFEDSSLDYIVSSNMIHHLAKPYIFFDECSRVLKKDGKLIIQEINNSLMMRAILKIMRHEGYSYDIDVFDKDNICNDPIDVWSANCAIPNLLFDDMIKFEQNFTFKCIYHEYSEFLIFPLSGGVIARKRVLNLPENVLKSIDSLDNILIAISKDIFPMQRRMVLKNVK